ncbi:UbiH/UbiF family hydroxylase [Rhizobium sp. L1K21]|uniref:UbiH/UbiF family hydroxylase n=1 Tax=Rhizobium sp. L1K21 TaxID=2954933 RepID=UPI0020936DD6|nr:UbiH/UbiF family hydroxylase [Rhizobium sp. L1K21]MCO6186036.1 UbiH/UbiF family hydroxylase [Rhizobium sp. L1K21]
MSHYEIAVVGGGLAGRIAALALSKQGYEIALVAPENERQDGRTTALMERSIDFLQDIGLWQNTLKHAAALSTMQIVDGTDRLFRAPTVPFRASDIGLEAFGYNFPNAPVLEILQQAIDAEEKIIQLKSKVVSATVQEAPATLTLESGDVISADFVVGADGRESPLRKAAGIDVKRWAYPQTAIVLNFSHELNHANTSTEFHTPSGPFTQVPLPGKLSSLVWVQNPQDAVIFLQLDPRAAARRIEERMQSMLGKVTIEGKIQGWPLSGLTAKRFGKGPLALIGEASHVFPPIGAQGLNLSLRDIIAIRDLLGAKREGVAPQPIGDAFDRRRRADIMSRTASVDLLNRSLLSGFLPVQFLRAAGLHILGTLSPLRNMVMREGVAPGEAFRALREQVGRKRA